jgi:competence protein ComEC
MIRWIPYAFIRITLVFIGGIITGISFPEFISDSVILALFVTCLVGFVVLFWIKQRWKISLNPGWIGFTAVFLAGIINIGYHKASSSPRHLLHLTKEIRQYEILITGYPENKGKNWKVVGEVVKVDTGTWVEAEGSVLLYLDQSVYKNSFVYGDHLIIRGSPLLLTGPANPHEFDYRKFLSYRNIYHQHFVREDQALLLGNDPPSIVMQAAMKMRAWSAATLKEYVPGDREQGIAAALVLGVTDGLDLELLQVYSSTGSMHVLAVSGLHISIIYWIILLLLKPVQGLKHGKWFVSAVALFVLWSYAFITGLSPSVLRAVTMFTFLEIARASSRNTNIFNTLASSAFCLLVFDPYLITSVGFQLSYMAVIGIVYIHPMLVTVFEPKSWLLNETWKITSVSIAAQVVTFPLGLFYFHQFPNYFLLSNLLVIPISFGVLILGLVVLAAAFFAQLAHVVGYLLGLCIKLMNLIVQGVDWLPFSLTDEVNINALQCWLLMGLIVAFVMMFQFKRFDAFVAGGICTLMFFAIHLWNVYDETRVKQIIVYRIPGHSAIDLVSDGKAYFSCDSTLRTRQDKIGFHIKPNRIAYSATENSCASFSREIQGGRVLVWHGQTILYISDKSFVAVPQSFDYVIIANNSVYDLAELRERIAARHFIFDSSNAHSYVGRLLEKNKSDVQIHSVLHHGAFQIFLGNES